MHVLALDTGYGDCKVVFGDSNRIINMYKFPSVAAEVNVNELVTDDRVITHKDNSFYIGKDALQVQSSSIIDISTYELLEYFSPMFLYKALRDLQTVPDIIVLGLSISQIKNSGHYKSTIEDFLRKSGSASKVYIVPQGVISKLAVDKYGIDFPNDTREFTKDSNYVLADIGFNTLDLAQVVNGATSSNLVRGIENRGAILIVNDLIVDIKERHGITLNISEAKDVLSNKMLKRRGVTYKVDDLIESAKNTYIENLKVIIENEFGSIIDKIDSLILTGGGSYILNPGTTGFVKSPSSGSEFYNALGFYLYGLMQSTKL